MRRLPAVLLLVAVPSFVAAFAVSASGASTVPVTAEEASVATSLKGTFLFTQTLQIAGVRGDPVAREGELIPFVDVSHLDDNGEIRTLSGVLHENGCGKVLSAGESGDFTVPFSASMGVGDWSAAKDWGIKAVYIHLLYECGGKPIGYAWVYRAGSPVWTWDLIPWEEGEDGKRGLPPNDFVGWVGQTTIRFFDLKGDTLFIPVPGIDTGVSELSGPFQALRVIGEPHR